MPSESGRASCFGDLEQGKNKASALIGGSALQKAIGAQSIFYMLLTGNADIQFYKNLLPKAKIQSFAESAPAEPEGEKARSALKGFEAVVEIRDFSYEYLKAQEELLHGQWAPKFGIEGEDVFSKIAGHGVNEKYSCLDAILIQPENEQELLKELELAGIDPKTIRFIATGLSIAM